MLKQLLKLRYTDCAVSQENPNLFHAKIKVTVKPGQTRSLISSLVGQCPERLIAAFATCSIAKI